MLISYLAFLFPINNSFDNKLVFHKRICILADSYDNIYTISVKFVNCLITKCFLFLIQIQLVISYKCKAKKYKGILTNIHT